MVYESKTDDHMDSVWVNCEQRGFQYWVHLRCLGYVIQDKNTNIFQESMKYFCPSHNQIKALKEKR